MPLPSDQRIVALADEILKQFDLMYGLHPGYRPAHAKGVLLTGMFTATPEAKAFTIAPHVQRASTPVTVRFSDSSAMPQIPDNAPNASPRGLAIRFVLGEHRHTDIISHSLDAFLAKDGTEFLDFLRAAAASGPDVPSPKPIEKFLASHPATMAFVKAPKPFPASFATDTYFAISAYEFTNAAGDKKFGRYRILPDLGNSFLSDEQAAKLPPNFLFDELPGRLEKGPIGLKIVVQIANPTDIVDDATVHWPEDRQLLQLGNIELTDIPSDSQIRQQHIIFDPIPRIAGIEPSADPLLELRAAVYLMSGQRRRAAEV